VGEDPDGYSSVCASGAFVLMERKFASPDERLRSLVSREKRMPALLTDARENLKNPPRIYTEMPLSSCRNCEFLRDDVPSAFGRREKIRE